MAEHGKAGATTQRHSANSGPGIISGSPAAAATRRIVMIARIDAMRVKKWFQRVKRSDRREMRKVISRWEEEHGPLTAEEKAEAREALGLRASTPGVEAAPITP